MSPQFGIWNFDNRPAEEGFRQEVNNLLASHGPDGQSDYTKAGILIAYSAFHTTEDSHCEVQPHETPSRRVITWDGRLDNRAGLAKELAVPLANDTADVAIVASSLERWDTRSFAKLTGDWALSVWNSADRALTLATD